MAKTADSQPREGDARPPDAAVTDPAGVGGPADAAGMAPEGAGASPAATPAEAAQRLRAAEAALRQMDHTTVRRAPAVYLNGDALDRGSLRLTRGSLRFDGWQGSIVILVQDIAEVRLGTSVLPRHAGVPLLGRVWPGRPRYAESLLLTVRVGSAAEPHVATVADLRDAARWRDAIARCRDEYDAWTQERARRVAEVEAAERDLARARSPEDRDSD